MDIDKILKKLAMQGIEALTTEEKDVLRNMGQRNSIHEFLSKISIEDIVMKGEVFRSLNIKKLTEEELFNALMNAISFDIDGSGMQKSIIEQRSITYSSGTRFYRIRKIEPDDHLIPLKIMSKEQDAWNAPAEFCKAGRLNKEGESLLYTSPLCPNICVEEMNIKDGEKFCLIVYELVREIKANMIGIWEDRNDYSKEENLKMRMITNTLKDMFTRDVGEGTEFLYRVSERIAKDYYDLSPEVQDAWCYPSIAAKFGHNVCFRPEKAREVLKLIGIQICSVRRVDEQYEFLCNAIAVWNKENEKFDYYSVDSPICRILFPEIKCS